LGGGRALLQVDRRLIFSDAIEHMPRNRMLLGLSQTETIDANLSNRLYDLHSRRGSRLLFIDYCRRDPREQLLELADAVQIDAFNLDAETRGLLIRRAQRRKLQILANSIQHDSDFVRIRDSGFDLLQGNAYSESSDNEETQANQEGKLLLQLLIAARGEFEIESVGQALIMIGAKGLSRWLNLLLFQVGSRNGSRGPLFRVAASRARLMELISLGSGEADAAAKDRGEAAFLVGILSLVHVLLGVDRSNAIAGLTLPAEMTQALTGFEGELGRMLRLAVCLDRGEFAEVTEVAAELSLDAKVLWGYQREAYDWVMRMG
jgi:EAL and modified HD-GYP domain-containing signal transduction protein